MLIFYNGECYDKDTLLSHLNKVVEQIESVGDSEISGEHKGCCAPKTVCQRTCGKCCSIRPNMESCIHHCCEVDQHCCGDITPVSCDINEICDREECSHCHHHIQPTICHHHPNRKCVTIRGKPKIQHSNNLQCPVCNEGMKNTCVIVPPICKNNGVKHAKCQKLPCITFPEDKNEKTALCKEKPDFFRANPFMINEHKSRKRNCNPAKNQLVVHRSSSPKKCVCENCHCCVNSKEMKALDLCACNKTNGLQDYCKLCHMPRGRLGYLKINK